MSELRCEKCGHRWNKHDCPAARAAAERDVAALRGRIEEALADEPVWKGGLVSEGVKRWYSEGWNRLRRDIEAILATEVER